MTLIAELWLNRLDYCRGMPLRPTARARLDGAWMAEDWPTKAFAAALVVGEHLDGFDREMAKRIVIQTICSKRTDFGLVLLLCLEAAQELDLTGEMTAGCSRAEIKDALCYIISHDSSGALTGVAANVLYHMSLGWGREGDGASLS
jgi:hypothetical protein